jgi:hypothetical protein
MAEYLESEPLRKKAAEDAQRAKLEALERRLGITPDAASGSGSGSGGEPSKVAGKKHRFDDTEYLEQSRELVEGVKSAVAAGLLKKRKKAKTAAAAASASTAPTTLEKVADAVASAPAAAIIAAGAGVAAGAIATAS